MSNNQLISKGTPIAASLAMVLAIFLGGAYTEAPGTLSEFIEVQFDDYDGSQTYRHVDLHGLSESWTLTDSNRLIYYHLIPEIYVDGDFGFTIGFTLSGLLPRAVGDATVLDRLHIETGPDAPVRTIEFYSSYMSGDALNGDASYTINSDFDGGNIIDISFLGGAALLLMEEIAYPFEEGTTSIRLETDQGDLLLDAPFDVRESLREFYEWAQEFYRVNNLAWPTL